MDTSKNKMEVREGEPTRAIRIAEIQICPIEQLVGKGVQVKVTQALAIFPR